ncbi:MAG: Ig-like domain repeat protein [Rhizobiales bacterium]|nr:Ig-like domain repeat protein [Hyphomicrobiales bacterium]
MQSCLSAVRRFAAALVLAVLAGLATPSAALAVSAGCTAVNAGALNATNSVGVTLTAAFLKGDRVRASYSGSTDWIYLSFPAGGHDNQFNQGTGTLIADVANNTTGVSWNTRYGTATVTATCIPAPATSNTGISSSANPATPGASVTFTATVFGNAGTPTGTVTFTDGATTLGTGTLSGGTATFSTAALTLGNHSIKASYGGDSNYAASTSGTLTQIIGNPTTTTSVSSSLNPARLGQSVTFTATVTASSGTPAGPVTFYDGATQLGTATLSGGSATFSTSALAIGNHRITVVYADSADHKGSTSAPLSQAVIETGTTTTLVSSRNPSEVGQAVTFTASVTSPGGTPTGSVSFRNGGTVIGTGTLAGGSASFTTSSLAKGSHVITAAYDGDGGFTASTSAGLTQAVNIPGDSVRLRSLQVIVTRMVAQVSGQAITGAVDAAIAEAFAEDGASLTPTQMSLRFNSGAASGERGGRTPRETRDWLFWMDIRGMSQQPVDTNTARVDIRGSQINALAGVTRRLTPGLVVGVMGGFESFDFTSQSLAGRLKGQGLTAGAYLGWQIMQGIRFDAALAHSWLDYEGQAGTASGAFAGRRLLASAGITGTYRLQAFVFEPSARVFGLWESQNAYIDSLGTAQDKNSFMTGRASGGLKVSYNYAYSPVVTLIPSLGLYGDYYFSGDSAAALNSTGTAAIVDGWSARLAAGLGLSIAGGAKMSIDGELGGLGSTTRRWTVRGKVAVPF